MATLVDAAQGLFLQRGDTAGLVARRGVALPDFLTHQPQSGLIAVDDLKDAVMHLRRSSPTGQNVLSADELRGLRQNRGASGSHDAVAHFANDRIRCQTAGGVGTTALRADDQFGNRKFLFLEHGGFGHHLLGIAHSHIHSLQRTAGLLDDDLLEGLVGALLNGLDHQVHLAVFAAERDDHRAVDVGIGGIACHHVHGKLLVRGHLRTALLIVEGNGAGHLLGNDTGSIGSAHTGRQDQHMIAHAHATVRTLITVKSHCSTLLTLSLPDFPGGLPHCEHGHVHRL